ncbi:TetR/AcrR family transcriptional regulator [Pseudonocardia eucalypti]|uniref:TetR/AcrR family transcriptional regulator n=1 Tax=Pseudonocardia eucalypti TaxID=648755 RepID=A0ABP9QPK2_9PSEU|nr:AcrR family transcriptional regulator [Pseudonocardia eucalypti]
MPRVTEQYIQRRRREILDAARQCFARDGFHATTMDDVIEAAGLSPSVVYRWFRGKDELVLETVRDTIQGIADAVDEAAAQDPPPALSEAIEGVLTATLARVSDDGRDLSALAVHIWTEALRTPEIEHLLADLYGRIRTSLADLVRRHQAAGTLPADIDADAAARPLFALLPGFLVQRLLLGPENTKTYAAAIATILRR